MIVAKFYENNSGKFNYIYEKNNKLIGFSVDNTGLNSIDMNLFKSIISNITFNDKCSKLFDYNGYELFYDPVNKLKHYMKNGKEDIGLFIKYNSMDACLYDGKRIRSNVAAICLAGVTFISSISFLSGCMASDIPTESIDKYIQFVENTTDYQNLKPLLDNNLTVEEAINFINSSPNLSDKDKKILANEDLLNDLIYYYNNGNVSNVICMFLNNMSVKYMPQKNMGEGVTGFYQPLNINVIVLPEEFLVDDNKYKESLTHEFIHLLQTDSFSYPYLTETSANLISSEYFNVFQNNNYAEGVKTLKLLIEIIGPQPILKGLFGADFSEFEEILRNNLSNNDYDLLVNDLLKKQPDEIIDREIELRDILKRLYSNIYKRDISKDANILVDYLLANGIDYTSNKNYVNFNYNGEYTKVSFSLNPLKYDEYVEQGILDKEETFIIRKRISYEEFLNFKEEGKDVYLDDKMSRVVDGKYILTKDIEYTLEEAIELGYLIPYLKDYISDKNELPRGWEFATDEYGETEHIVVYTRRLDGKVVTGFEEINFETLSIKSRFPSEQSKRNSR